MHLLKYFLERKLLPAFCYDALHTGSFGRRKPYGTVFNNNTADIREETND